MAKISFSILMSVYKGEKPRFLDYALHSNLIRQTVKADEMVLICDGPLTEELDAVIAKYTAHCPELRVFRLEKNGGLGNALRYGMTKCRYEWVARADSDDISLPRRFELQTAYLQAHPDTDILGGSMEEFNEDWRRPAYRKVMPMEHEEICRMVKLRNPMCHVTVMMRKKAVQDCGGYLDMAYVEDYYLWIRAILGGAKLHNLEETMVYVRVGNGMLKRRSNHAYVTSWRKLSSYMRQHHMINAMEYVMNMTAIVVFVYVPSSLKAGLYSKLLRNEEM